MASFTTRSPTTVSQQPCQIVTVDLINMRATAQTRTGTTIAIDLKYYVGGVHTVPSTNDQWIVRWYGNSWVLDTQLAFNATELATVAADPQQGTVQIGNTNPAGSGALYLSGSTIIAKAPVVVPATPTSTRPNAAVVGAGAHVFDTTLNKPIWSNGIGWVDSTGVSV